MEIVTEEEILNGEATDKYFERTEDALEEIDENPEVVAEITERQYTGEDWRVFTGLHEVAEIFKNLEGVDLYALEEGRISNGGPVAKIKGNYKDFARYETAILGILSHHGGIATAATKARLRANNSKLLSFGSRHIHPSNGCMIARNSMIAGLDGYSFTGAEKYLSKDASGTMPHALMLSMGRGNQEKAWNAFNDSISEELPTIILCDTFNDEVDEVLRAAEELGEDLDGVRLDTTSSRRGDYERIIKEVKIQLSEIGREDVDIYVSGGLGYEEIENLDNIVDGFGIGSLISEAECVDYSLDIVEVNGEPISKRGKLPGEKKIVHNFNTNERGVKRVNEDHKTSESEDYIKPVVVDGDKVMETSVEKAREVLKEELSLIRKLS